MDFGTQPPTKCTIRIWLISHFVVISARRKINNWKILLQTQNWLNKTVPTDFTMRSCLESCWLHQSFFLFSRSSISWYGHSKMSMVGQCLLLASHNFYTIQRDAFKMAGLRLGIRAASYQLSSGLSVCLWVSSIMPLTLNLKNQVILIYQLM